MEQPLKDTYYENSSLSQTADLFENFDLSKLKSFTRPYLYPFIPFNFKDMIKQLFRIPYNKKEKTKKAPK